MSSVVLDGVKTHHFGIRPEPAAAGEVVDLLEAVVSAPPSREALAQLHELLAGQSAVDIADDLGNQLRSRGLPRVPLRAVARHLSEYGSARNTVKLGIVVLGVCGDRRDRELLLLLGALEELTLYAVVALARTQTDRQYAVYELAQRVQGWGRIHAVERLRGCDDPQIKAWLLREGYRNGIMDEYLAHLAATTGDLYTALLDSEVDTALLEGAGGILSALAMMGGPFKDMSHYADAVPAMHRYAELADEAEPTLSMLDHLLTLDRFIAEPASGFTWADHEPDQLRHRYQALLARPAWRELVRAHLASPVGPSGFNTALSCASRLDMPVLPQALEYLERDPFNAYVWQWVIDRCDTETATRAVTLATRILPLDELASGPSTSHGFGPEHAPNHALEAIVNGLRKHPGAGLQLVECALSNPVIRVRSGALRTLRAWPTELLPPQIRDWITTAAAAEPNTKLQREMRAFLSDPTTAPSVNDR